MDAAIHPAANRPAISIGMPVFNAEHYIQRALDSLVNQTFTDFELIISDNASTDSTETICKQYAFFDKRIQYVRQGQNMGASFNFRFVLEKAVGKYFMWAAADDWRSSDFLEKNFDCLERQPEFVASTSPNGFENQSIEAKRVDFSISGNQLERFNTFFTHCWRSHAIFYSLIRKYILIKCPFLNTEDYLAKDWSIVMFLLCHGSISRIREGDLVFGIHGMSMRKDYLKSMRNRSSEALFPLWQFSCDVVSLSQSLRWTERLRVLLSLVKLNADALGKLYKTRQEIEVLPLLVGRLLMRCIVSLFHLFPDSLQHKIRNLVLGEKAGYASDKHDNMR